MIRIGREAGAGGVRANSGAAPPIPRKAGAGGVQPNAGAAPPIPRKAGAGAAGGVRPNSGAASSGGVGKGPPKSGPGAAFAIPRKSGVAKPPFQLFTRESVEASVELTSKRFLMHKAQGSVSQERTTTRLFKNGAKPKQGAPASGYSNAISLRVDEGKSPVVFHSIYIGEMTHNIRIGLVDKACTGMLDVNIGDSAKGATHSWLLNSAGTLRYPEVKAGERVPGGSYGKGSTVGIKYDGTKGSVRFSINGGEVKVVKSAGLLHATCGGRGLALFLCVSLSSRGDCVLVSPGIQLSAGDKDSYKTLLSECTPAKLKASVQNTFGKSLCPPLVHHTDESSVQRNEREEREKVVKRASFSYKDGKYAIQAPPQPNPKAKEKAAAAGAAVNRDRALLAKRKLPGGDKQPKRQRRDYDDDDDEEESSDMMEASFHEMMREEAYSDFCAKKEEEEEEDREKTVKA